jgi:hypothetical protein
MTAQFRRAAETDLTAEWTIFNRAQGGLYKQHGFPRNETPFERFASPHRHLQRHDADRCFVAVADEQVVAFVAACVRSDMWFLSALFVDPEYQGKGIGNQLLQLASAGWPARRMTITDAIQPISNALYARMGLLPSTPILVMGGAPKVELPDGLDRRTPSPADLAALDQAAYGFDRSVDHSFWSSQSQAQLWCRNGEPLAYSYVSEQGWLGPLAGRDEDSAALALRAELSQRPQVMLEIPGSCSALVETAFGAGLRIINPPGLLLHSRPVTLPTSLVISGYWFL